VAAAAAMETNDAPMRAMMRYCTRMAKSALTYAMPYRVANVTMSTRRAG